MKRRSFLILNCIFFLNVCYAQSKLALRIDSLFTHYLDSGFSGSVLVAAKNKIVLKKGYGYANNTTKKKNTPTTLFNTASLGKQFTAYSILLLEKRGLLRTNDYLSKYIGKFNDIRDSVTMHHLLLHSSGVFKEGADLDYTTRVKFIQSVKETPPESKPGEKFRYSNAGYSMLAAVVEIASGEPFEKFMLENIFKPTRGPGHVMTSVMDIYKWIRSFDNEKFMPAGIKNKLFYDHLPGKETYSWNKDMTTRKTRFYHKGGGRPDFETRLMWYPDDETLIIFCINNDYNLARILFSKIRAIMN